MKRYLLVLLVLLSLASVQAETIRTDVCVSDLSCSLPGEYTEGQCLSQGEFYETMSDQEYRALCETGCCQLSDIHTQVIASTCEQWGGEFSAGEACPTETEYSVCEQGSSDCICDGALITDQVCCYDESQATARDSCDAPDEGTGSSTGALCGNNQIDDGEVCDYSVEGDYGTCPDVQGQGCTRLCNCEISADDYPPGDVCNPLNEDCRQETTCEPTIMITSVEAVTGTAELTVTYDVSADCAPNPKLELTWTSGQKSVSMSASPSGETGVSPIQAETTYEFVLAGVFQIGPEQKRITSEPYTYTTGDEECFTATREFCQENTLQVCDENNELLPATQCETCITTQEPDGYSARCEDTSIDCAACNIGYDTLSESRDNDERVVMFGDDQYTCGELLEPISDGSQTRSAYCYLAYQSGAAKQYEACTTVNRCADYATRDSCTSNFCFADTAGCSWNEQADVCVSESTDEDTTVCDYPGLTEQQCMDIEGCAYVGETCTKQSEITCALYTDSYSCVGDMGGFELDEQTNVERRFSDSEHGLTKCVWKAQECIKDSDRDNIAEIGDAQYDFTNPETTLLADFQEPFGPQPVIPFSVDDESATTTYGYLAAQPCEQVEREARLAQTKIINAKKRVFNLTAADQDGQYCLTYYSDDSARNLEHVKQQDITISKEDPQIVWNETTVLVDAEKRSASIRFEYNLSMKATCTFDFDDEKWTGYGDAFNKYYKDLEEKQYPFTLTCTSPTGKLQVSETFGFDFNNTITNPFPKLATYTSQQVTRMGVQVRDDQAQCEYAPYGTDAWNPLEKEETGTQYTRYAVQVSGLQTGFSLYDVRCTLSDGTQVLGSSADRIAFAIDDQAPVLRIYTTGEGDEQIELTQQASIPYNGLPITIVCEDPEIPGVEGQYEDDFSAGAVTISDADGQIEADSGYETTLMPETTLTLTCSDALENTQQLTINTQINDINGPARPQFTAVNP